MLNPRRWLASAATGIAVIVLAIGSMLPIAGQTKVAAIDETIPPGANFDKAEFRFWIPQDSGPVRAVVVLVPGSNGDGRPMADDAFWQAFATKQKLAIVACRFTDKPKEQSFIEDYVNVSKGSGQALLDVLARFATRSAHPEVAGAPLLMWGMSAGGQFNYEFTAWKPERVAAFVVNKGGIYYSALLPRAARAVPGLLFVGGTDLQSRIDTITGLFAVNRRGGAVWALVSEPGLGHVVGHSRDLGALFFEEVLAWTAPGPGFAGDLKTFAVQPAATPGTPSTPNAWLISERFAKAWQAVVGSAKAPTSTPASAPKTVALRFGSAVTGLGQTLSDAVIVVEGDRIKSVGTGDRALPAGAEVIDLRKYTAIPGLIDAHTHMTYFWDPASGTLPLKQPRREPAMTVELSAANARRTLDTGVTTARDLGASGGTDYSMRDLINAGRMIGPRMFVAGQGISGGRGGPNPDGMKAQVEARITAGSDWIKVYASRGSYQSVDTTQTMTFEEMKAIVDAAHALGKPVAIHSYGASGVKDAVRAGADSIEHGIELDDETLAMMAKQGTVWVPTVDHNRYYVDAKDEFGFAPDTIPPLQAYIEKNLDATRRAIKAGVMLAMGSDAVYSMFGQNTRELAWFVKAGMTPAQALATATAIPAKMLGQEKQLGRIAAGAFADIVAVEGDPLKDINVVINQVRWVMKGGVVHKER